MQPNILGLTSRAEIILSWQVVSGRRTAQSLGSASRGNGIWTLEQHWEWIVRVEREGARGRESERAREREREKERESERVSG